MKLCINCYTENPDDAVMCSECGMSLRRVPEGEEATRLKEEMEAKIARASAVILTTGFEVQGRPIAHYLGIITSEIVMGTGAFTEFLGGWADFFGGRAGQFELKLERAKDAALNSLRAKAILLGAEAVIGIDIDYMTVGQNMLMVVASGTAVKLREGGDSEEDTLRLDDPAARRDTGGV